MTVFGSLSIHKSCWLLCIEQIRSFYQDWIGLLFSCCLPWDIVPPFQWYHLKHQTLVFTLKRLKPKIVYTYHTIFTFFSCSHFSEAVFIKTCHAISGLVQLAFFFSIPCSKRLRRLKHLLKVKHLVRDKWHVNLVW